VSKPASSRAAFRGAAIQTAIAKTGYTEKEGTAVTTRDVVYVATEPGANGTSYSHTGKEQGYYPTEVPAMEDVGHSSNDCGRVESSSTTRAGGIEIQEHGLRGTPDGK